MRRLTRLVASLLIAIGLGVGLLGCSTATQAPPTASVSGVDAASGLMLVTLSRLPSQATTVYNQIIRGGPFQYPRNDGVVYHNNNRVLPAKPDGYYHEYTVPTPGSSDRGSRRIVKGDGGEFYYTGDHYNTFVRIQT